jgi:8-oxo-dGTP pyrophosphatase MutT (NUDIX family)
MNHPAPLQRAADDGRVAPDDMEPGVKRQVVAGFIIFRRTEEGIKYLLLYRRGGYWNFPKGHFEEGESAMETALRETFEETGIKREELAIAPNFKTLVRFHFKVNKKIIHDTVILYLAETNQAHVVLSPREHSGFAWFLYSDAMKILGRYVGTKRALAEANNFLRPKGNRGGSRHTQRKDGHIQGGGNPSRQPQGRPGGRQHS